MRKTITGPALTITAATLEALMMLPDRLSENVILAICDYARGDTERAENLRGIEYSAYILAREQIGFTFGADDEDEEDDDE